MKFDSRWMKINANVQVHINRFPFIGSPCFQTLPHINSIHSDFDSSSKSLSKKKVVYFFKEMTSDSGNILFGFANQFWSQLWFRVIRGLICIFWRLGACIPRTQGIGLKTNQYFYIGRSLYFLWNKDRLINKGFDGYLWSPQF